MRACISASLAVLLLLFGLPWLTATVEKPAAPPTDKESKETLSADESVMLRVWDGEKTQEMTVAEYLPGVVRGEMPATFEMEALKAQAVAERTYIYYKIETGGKESHPDADVCMSPACCNAYTPADKAAQRWGDKAEEYEARIQEAVHATDGQVMLYEDQPILAAFHSSSDGKTASSGDVWVSNLPYLTSVASPEGESNVPNYYSVKEIPLAEFKSTFLAAHPEAVFPENANAWIGEAEHNNSGRVEKIPIGGVSVDGTEVRSLFGLRSASFTTETDGEKVTFRVTGYGHGVGMSQYGANEMARQGKTWQEILQWYYTGVRLDSYCPHTVQAP